MLNLLLLRCGLYYDWPVRLLFKFYCLSFFMCYREWMCYREYESEINQRNGQNSTEEKPYLCFLYQHIPDKPI